MYVMHMERVFFFKQKTAYEMRISDWSSDVCSSDLGDRGGMLSRARRHPSPLADGAGALQGLHLDPQAQRLSLAAHHGDPRRYDAHRGPADRKSTRLNSSH